MSTLARMHGKPGREIIGVRAAALRQPGARFGDGRARYRRQEDDWYVEDRAAVEALLSVERFAGAIHDPACGIGTIPSVCSARGYRVSGADKADRGWGAPGVDYLTAPGRVFDNIISNPPYRAAVVVPFIEKACAEARFKVAMLLRLAFLEGVARNERLFQKFPLARLWVFSWRISCPPGDQEVERKGGQMPFAWFVWERGWPGPHYQGGWL